MSERLKREPEDKKPKKYFFIKSDHSEEVRREGQPWDDLNNPPSFKELNSDMSTKGRLGGSDALLRISADNRYQI